MAHKYMKPSFNRMELYILQNTPIEVYVRSNTCAAIESEENARVKNTIWLNDCQYLYDFYL